MGWISVIVILLLAGIIILSGKGGYQFKSRDQYLQDLTKLLEGKIELIDAGESESNSFRILFTYKGQQCVYEDYEKQGFKDKVYKAYLRVSIPTQLTVTLKEKKKASRIKTDIFLASRLSSKYGDELVSLQIPKFLRDMEVNTNDPIETNKLFEDRKIRSIYKKFKNIDSRGYPFSALQIQNGVIVLEFYDEKIFTPNIQNLWGNTAVIEDYLGMILLIARKLKL